MPMDSADSVSLIDTRDSLPMDEDDGALSVVAELVKDATLLFQAGKFDECLRALDQLLQKKESDPKVRHNIAIAKIFQEGLSGSKRFIEALENIKKQEAERDHASKENLKTSSDNGEKSKATSNEFDASLSMYNIAVIWFYLYEYGKSFSCLDAMFKNMEPIDKATSVQICFLLLDVALFSRQASKSADVISYMEDNFCMKNQMDNGTLTQQQSLLASKSNSFLNSSNIPDAPDSVPASTFDNSSSRELSDEAPEEEPSQLLSSFGEGLQRFYAIASSNDTSRSQAEEIRLKLHLYKVQFFLLAQNLKAAKREVKMAMNIPLSKDSPVACYLKSQLECSRGNYPKAVKLLIASCNHTDIESMYNNNLGCIFYRMGQHQTSGVFFSKALSSSLVQRKGKLARLAQDKSLLITYNCGIQSLACGRPLHAARCFQTASVIFYNRPLLWLRIAECCIMALEKGLINSASYTSDKSVVKVSVIGQGKWRQLAIRPDESDNDNLSPENPNLSMSLARQCLFNALHLLDTKSADSQESGSNVEVKEQKVRSSSFHSSIPEYESTVAKENEMIKQAVLADLAYAELALGNPLPALSAAKSLLKSPNCPRVYLFLGTMYAAEALCLLNRPNEAGEYLMLYISIENTVELPYTLEDCEKLTVQNVLDSEVPSADESVGSTFLRPEEARGIFCANYAANFALLGDMEKAHQFVMKALTDIPNNPKALLTAIYVDLKCGKNEEAVAKLKQHSNVRFLPGGLPLNAAS